MLGKGPFMAINQLFEADIVYVRNFMKSDEMDDEQSKHLALVAHHWICRSRDELDSSPRSAKSDYE